MRGGKPIRRPFERAYAPLSPLSGGILSLFSLMDSEIYIIYVIMSSSRCPAHFFVTSEDRRERAGYGHDSFGQSAYLSRFSVLVLD